MDYEQLFIAKYGESEIDLPKGILTIRDDYPSPFSSGSNGYITTVRVKNNQFEFYHDFWGGGWMSRKEVDNKFPHAGKRLDKMIRILIQDSLL